MLYIFWKCPLYVVRRSVQGPHDPGLTGTKRLIKPAATTYISTIISQQSPVTSTLSLQQNMRVLILTIGCLLAFLASGHN